MGWPSSPDGPVLLTFAYKRRKEKKTKGRGWKVREKMNRKKYKRDKWEVKEGGAKEGK